MDSGWIKALKTEGTNLKWYYLITSKYDFWSNKTMLNYLYVYVIIVMPAKPPPTMRSVFLEFFIYIYIE